MTNTPCKTDVNEEGGYTVPDSIAITLYRWQLLELLIKRAGLNHCYFFDIRGWHVIKGKENND